MKKGILAACAILFFLAVEPCLAAIKSESPAAAGITLSFCVSARNKNLISGSAVLYSALEKKRTIAEFLVAAFAVILLIALAKNKIQEIKENQK